MNNATKWIFVALGLALSLTMVYKAGYDSGHLDGYFAGADEVRSNYDAAQKDILQIMKCNGRLQ